jgi:hypothetical protein
MAAQPNDDSGLLSSLLLEKPDQPEDNDQLLVSYLSLRKAVGMIGLALPFVLALGKLLLEGPGLEGSVSGYYYTPMRDVFVGSLCAIAVFLWTYKGYDWRDDVAGNVASVAAVGVALFPTAPAEATAREALIGSLHLAAAAVFFLALAYFSLALFRQSDERNPTPEKLQRNKVYTACGYTILGCLALIAALGVLPDVEAVERLAPVFWLEALAIVAFGVSWLTKGEAILKDRGVRLSRW